MFKHTLSVNLVFRSKKWKILSIASQNWIGNISCSYLSDLRKWYHRLYRSKTNSTEEFDILRIIIAYAITLTFVILILYGDIICY